MRTPGVRAFSPIAAVTVAIVFVLVFVLASLPFALINLSSFALFACPFLHFFLAAVGGPLHAGLAILALMSGLLHVSGVPAAAAAMLYLSPAMLVFCACHEKRLPFLKTVAFVLAAYIFSVLALYLWAQAASGGRPFEAASEAAVEAFGSLRDRDGYLYLLLRSGLLSLGQDPSAHIHTSPDGSVFFLPDALAEFSNQIRTRIDLWLRSLVPSLVSSYGIYLSLLGTGTALQCAERKRSHAEDVGDRLMPAFALWHVPRRFGRLLWTLALGSLLTRLSAGNTLYLAGTMMYNVFSAVQSVQGLSLIHALQNRRGVRAVPKWLTAIALFVLFQPILMFIGVYDQLFDPRKLRAATKHPLS